MNMMAVLVSCLLQAAGDGAERPKVSLSDFDALVKNNIFAPEQPPRPVVKVETAPEPPPAPAGPRAVAPVVTGFIFDTASSTYQVVVEDRNTLESLRRFSGPMFLKEGEEFLDYKVDKITANRVTVVYKEETTAIALGETFPGGAPLGGTGSGSGSTSGSGGSSAPSVDVEDPGVKSILERLKQKNKRD